MRYYQVRGFLNYVEVDGDEIVVGRPNFYPPTMKGGVMIMNGLGTNLYFRNLTLTSITVEDIYEGY